MIHPVRIYKKHPDEGGRVRKVISSKTLQRRSDKEFADKLRAEVSSNLRPKPMVLKPCEYCGKDFKTAFPETALYCPGTCSETVKRKSNQLRCQEYRQRKREKNQPA